MNLKIGNFLHVLSLILEKTHLFVGDRPSSKERSEEKTCGEENTALIVHGL